ncbi:MAG TPA: hypothetical protein VHF90_01730 [Thermoleophilaceae bacterium]|nr:hypothetical protein [Thermoleophilaceae bacterium]
MATEFRLRGLLEHLTRHGVDFVVVGGVAAALHGSDRNTFDLDVCPAQGPDNLEALGNALTEIDARLRGIEEEEEEEVPFVADGRALAGIEILTLSTSLGPLDVLVRPYGNPSYAALRRRASRLELEAGPVLVASIDDLIAMKRESDRPKDRDDIERLEALARLSRRLTR